MIIFCFTATWICHQNVITCYIVIIVFFIVVALVSKKRSKFHVIFYATLVNISVCLWLFMNSHSRLYMNMNDDRFCLQQKMKQCEIGYLYCWKQEGFFLYFKIALSIFFFVFLCFVVNILPWIIIYVIFHKHFYRHSHVSGYW